MQKAVKQTVLGTVFSYAGIILGAFYMLFIIPGLFDAVPGNYGALLLIVNYAGLFLIFSSLATPLSVIKFSPLYSGKERSELLSFLLSINTIGLLCSFLVFYLYSQHAPIFITLEGEQVNISYFFYPVLCSITLFSFFESYCHTLLKVAVPAFLNNTFTRFWFFAVLLLYYYETIGFKTFTYLYFGQFIASFLGLLFFVWTIKKDEFRFSFKLHKDYKTILKYMLYALPATSVAVIVTKIDVVMIGRILGEAEVAFYGYAIYFMTVLLTPKNILMQTARSIFSKNFQTQSLQEFQPQYHKISFAFILTTLSIFIAIMINMNDLMAILGDKFGSNETKYAIFILGLGRVIEALFVSNYAVLEYSKYYKKILNFEVGSLIVVVVLNLLLIPYWGIVGAATSSACVFIGNGLLKSIFVYRKLRLIPIEKSSLVIIFSVLLLCGLYFLPSGIFQLTGSTIYDAILSIGIRSLCFLLGLFGIFKYFKLQRFFSL